MREIYEHAEMREYGGGSGTWSQEVRTEIGVMRIIHWSLSKGFLTEIYVEGWFGSVRPWPTIKLDGHVKPPNVETDLLSYYVGKLLALGGTDALVEGIKAAVKLGEENGAITAQRKMREALGIL